MIVPAGNFSTMLTQQLHAVVTLSAIDRAIGTMLWFNLPWPRRVWLRLRRRKQATIAQLAERWNSQMPSFFRADDE